MRKLSIPTLMVGVSLVGCQNAERTTCLDGPREVRVQVSLPQLILDKTDALHLGSSADNIVSHFALHYHNEAAALGINLAELYQALWTDGEVNPPDWDTMGRQVNVYK